MDENHEEKEAWLLICRKGCNESGLRLDEAVEEAICYGWIDGKLLRFDGQHFLLRFTPRRKNSIWSERNVERARRMIVEDRMTAAGQCVLDPSIASGEDPMDNPRRVDLLVLSQPLEAELKKHPLAWIAYLELSPSHRKAYIHWITSAKKPETRFKRLQRAIERLEIGEEPNQR